MIKAIPRHSSVIIAVCFLAMHAACLAAEPAIVDKARAYLGGEQALDGVTALHYIGTLTVDTKSADAAGKEQPSAQVAVEIIFQKPSRQRSVITSDKRIEITVLDDYEGWQKVQDPADPARWTMNLLSSDQIKSLRANVWENLSFFRGLEGRRGTIEEMGTVTVEGVVCRKVAFVHSPKVAFYRYFDLASGKLVLTETQQGETIREQGEIISGGIKFPKTLVTTMARPDGSSQQVTIRFEKVTVNENFADSLFVMPSLGSH